MEGFPGLESVLTEKDGKRHLHLVNFQTVHTGNRKMSLYDPVEHISPVRDVKIRYRGGAASVVLQPAGLPLDFTTNGEWAEFTVPEVHIYIVEIEA